MATSPDIAAVGCTKGGFAATGLLAVLKPEIFKFLRRKPKIFFGYSDFSLILNALFSRGIVSFHAPNLAGLAKRSLNTQKSLRLSLLGELPSEIGPLSDWRPLVAGFAKGRLLVSNLQCLLDLVGTPFDPLAAGDEDLILALEETGEDKSNIRRWLERLIAHPQAGRIKGIILGRFTQIGEKEYPVWGRQISVSQIFLQIFRRTKIPIASWPEFGHIEEKRGLIFRAKGREKTDFLSLPSGVKVLFKVKAESCRLKFLEKAVI